MGTVAVKGKPKRATGIALQCVGCGCLLSLYYGGPVGTVFFGQLLTGWGHILAAQALFLVATALASGALCATRGLWQKGSRRLLARLSTAAALGVFCLAFVLARLGAGPIAGLACAAALGCTLSFPMLQWFTWFLAIYRDQGRGRCIALLAGSQLVSMATTAFASPAGTNPATALIAACFVTFASFAAQEVIFHLADVAPAPEPKRVQRQEEPYRLSAYSVSVLACFGVTWGLAFGLLTSSGTTAAPVSRTIMLVSGALTCCAFIAVFLGLRTASRVQFGLILRLAVALAGATLVAAPILLGRAPTALWALCQAALVLQAVVMNLFAMEICHDNGRDIAEVWPKNYLVFVASATIALTGFYLLTTRLDPHEAADYMALAVALVTFAVIPLLPSQSSDASALTRRTLPENEGYDERMAQSRRNIAVKYGLSVREEEVLDLLLAGKTRDEIAEALALSTWTVRDYVKNVYAKTGMHSVKELMILAASGEGR